MIVLILRIALTALAIGFMGWLGYIIYLGLKSFFNKERKTSGGYILPEDMSKNHKRRRGRLGPIEK